jgi:hypothetical protein
VSLVKLRTGSSVPVCDSSTSHRGFASGHGADQMSMKRIAVLPITLQNSQHHSNSRAH